MYDQYFSYFTSFHVDLTNGEEIVRVDNAVYMLQNAMLFVTRFKSMQDIQYMFSTSI